VSEISRAVFLSYASQDAEAARRICEALRAAGVEVWFDQSELRGGDSWDQKIRRQTKECALFVPVISANTQARAEGYFRLEWHLAEQRTYLMGRNKAFLLPVCVDQTPDDDADVPDSFTAVQWTRLSDGEPPPAFVERVQRLLQGEPEARSTEPGEKTWETGPPAPWSAATAPAVDPKSVAVLAFANLSEDKGNEYFSDGISEELLNVLAKVPGLKVSARTSAFHFKGKDTPIPEIARQLGVAHVVEGSVRKAGDRVRITAQLIKAADGFHVWSDTFTRDLKDIFAVQDEIAGLIAENLSLKLGTTSTAGVVNPAAYQLFLQGRAIFNREIPDDYPKAIQCYKASLEIDGNSALTWAWLSMAYVMSASMGVLPIEFGFELARDAANRAIALDPELANGHAALGVVHFAYDWDWARSEKSLQRAAALAPGEAGTMSFLSNLAQAVGQTERAVQLGRKAVELDPKNTLSAYILGKGLFQAGLFAELEKQGEHMVALNPAGFYGFVFLTYARLLQGRIDDAAQAAEQVPREFFRLTCLAHVRHAQGRAAEAEAALGELKARFGADGAYQIAEIHAARNEMDQAFEWLDISYRQRDPGMTWLKHDAFFRKMNNDARWLALLRKMRLAADQLQ
jgi:TolB-like protein